MIRLTSIFILLGSLAVFAQTETLRNSDVVDMSRSGLDKSIILKKIGSSNTDFDVSAKGLIELKSNGVADEVIAFMMEVQPAVEKSIPISAPPATRTDSVSAVADKSPVRPRTISFEKSSVHPSRQALEKELLKRKDFRDLGLTIMRYKEQADLYAEIGFVSGSWLTHRYVYRIYDRRNGAVVAAGETTSWGSLAENLARHIAKRLTVALSASAQK